MGELLARVLCTFCLCSPTEKTRVYETRDEGSIPSRGAKKSIVVVREEEVSMSAPGYLTSAELTTIGPDAQGDYGKLNLVAGAWFRKTDRELRAAFGFGIDFRNDGTYRTMARQRQINPGQTVSDHLRGRALDIRNWKAFVEKDALKFYRILAQNGWKNIQVNGLPFRSEPWHYVCVKTSAPSTPTAPKASGIERKKKTWHG